ncbi:MAG: NAD(P)-dependent oxidoreductase [Litoreibacter sp.]|nr:NAD(P)-dependent oxidoreductase [Litoreibacter sp.]
MTSDIAFIGFGEAASAIASGWSDRRNIRSYDIKTDDPKSAPDQWAKFEKFGVTGCHSSAEAVSGAKRVFSTATADQAVVTARTAAPHLASGTYWFDLNSCAPSSKKEAAALLEAVGVCYVDVAVMAPIHPKRNMTPLLVSGPHAQEAKAILADLPMAPRIVEGPVGAASSIKMIRSVMVKGMEALTAECILAARAAGVDEAVLASLKGGNPPVNWPAQAAYNFERVMLHGVRRASEMREVVKSLEDLGLPADMARATVDWQSRIGTLGIPAAEGADYADLADQLLPHVRTDD